jgi:hypothetical protein
MDSQKGIGTVKQTKETYGTTRKKMVQLGAWKMRWNSWKNKKNVDRKGRLDAFQPWASIKQKWRQKMQRNYGNIVVP